MRSYRFILLCLSLLVVNMSPAQEIPDKLSIDKAVELAMEHNFDIRIAKNNVEISQNNTEIGNAGWLPTVSLSGAYDYSRKDTKTEFSPPEQPPIDASGAVTENYNAGVNLNYNIFSGGSRIYTYQRLQSELYSSELQQRQQVELTVAEVIRQYLETLNLYDAFRISKEAVSISNERYARAKENYAYGNFSKLELLNAEVDLSNDSTSLLQSRLDFEKAQKDLNNTMGIKPSSQYELDTTFNYSEDLRVGEMIDQAMADNSNYLLARNQVQTSEFDLKLSRSSMFPKLDLLAGYTYNRTSFDANFVDLSRDVGWNAGLSLSFNVFDGGRVKRQQENARIQMESRQVALEQSENDLRTSILNAYSDFSTNLELLKLSKRSLKLAEVNYERSKEAFSLGQITGIELREAQLNYLNAKFNVSLQRIQTKNSEVNLYYFTGSLVQ